MEELEAKIYQLEKTIALLHRCKIIFHKGNMTREYVITMNDIKHCEDQLKSLKAARNAESEKAKGKVCNDAAIQRSRTGFSP